MQATSNIICFPKQSNAPKKKNPKQKCRSLSVSAPAGSFLASLPRLTKAVRDEREQATTGLSRQNPKRVKLPNNYGTHSYAVIEVSAELLEAIAI